MDNRVEVRAYFTGCNIKAGKTVMQFELDPEYKAALPQLAIMTGTPVTLELTSDQKVLFVDANTGEEIDGQEEAFTDDFEDDPDVYELPPAEYEYEDAEYDEAA